jgi:hypothetical protein
MSDALFRPPVAQESAPQVQGPMPADVPPMTISMACQQLMALIAAQNGQLTPQDQQAVGLLIKGLELQARQYGGGQPEVPPGGAPGQQGPPDEGTSDQFSEGQNTGPNTSFIGLQ